MSGGAMSHGINEVSGESASGKTQLCLQLCLTVQLPHDNGGLNAGISSLCCENCNRKSIVFPKPKSTLFSTKTVG